MSDWLQKRIVWSNMIGKKNTFIFEQSDSAHGQWRTCDIFTNEIVSWKQPELFNLCSLHIREWMMLHCNEGYVLMLNDSQETESGPPVHPHTQNS